MTPVRISIGGVQREFAEERSGLPDRIEYRLTKPCNRVDGQGWVDARAPRAASSTSASTLDSSSDDASHAN